MADNPLTPFSAGTVGLFRRLFGPAASEIGEALADKVRDFRSRNLRKILTAAEEKVQGVEVQELPLRFSIPLIEHASREDDPTLTEMWANLLASAAGGVEDEHYLLSRILSNLTPTSVELLDHIVGNFYKNDDWYNGVIWEYDWIYAVEKFIKEEIEPQIHEGAFEGDHQALGMKFFEFDHEKPFWIFRVELPYVPNSLKAEVDGGRDKLEVGQIVLPLSVESPSLQILEREQLVSRKHHEFDFKYCPFPIWYAAATPLAVELVRVCNGMPVSPADEPEETENETKSK